MEIDIEITCRKCNRKFKHPMKKMKPGNSCTCPACKSKIVFTGDGLGEAADSINKTIDDIKKTFNDLNK